MADAWWGWNKKDEKLLFQYEEVDNLLVYAFDKLNDLKICNE